MTNFKDFIISTALFSASYYSTGTGWFIFICSSSWFYLSFLLFNTTSPFSILCCAVFMFLQIIQCNHKLSLKTRHWLITNCFLHKIFFRPHSTHYAKNNKDNEAKIKRNQYIILMPVAVNSKKKLQNHLHLKLNIP